MFNLKHLINIISVVKKLIKKKYVQFSYHLYIGQIIRKF